MKEMKILNETEVQEALDRTKVRRALRSAFEGLSTGSTVQPAQTLTLFPKDEGDCIFYPGVIYDLDLIGVKVSPYISALERDGKYPVTAYTLLMSASSGQPILLCDSYALTTCRTAATTALALEFLTPPNSKKLALIGTGKVALEHLSYVAEQHDWNEISVWSPSLNEDAVKEKDILKKIQAISSVAGISESAEDAVKSANVVMLCTSSGSKVIETKWLSDNVVVTSISTNVQRAHEIDPKSLSEFTVFCDYKETAPITAGEMVIAIEDGYWDASQISGDLNDLITGNVLPPQNGKVFFRSTGLGIEDLAIASLLTATSN
ncbi:ornithine cyclodeaminase family protein [Pseudoalteromonas sp. NJ631]|uniref:ornithine cyclodeaminase family protein n=1 Tax=Pseudoalteromonas sp. NJ631 TaxID=493915 RepID=UPI00036A1C87|nr:ornithine cyclodeaminase family protein [Pseudoalteromonas sp. NJ631]